MLLILPTAHASIEGWSGFKPIVEVYSHLVELREPESGVIDKACACGTNASKAHSNNILIGKMVLSIFNFSILKLSIGCCGSTPFYLINAIS